MTWFIIINPVSLFTPVLKIMRDSSAYTWILVTYNLDCRLLIHGASTVLGTLDLVIISGSIYANKSEHING